MRKATKTEMVGKKAPFSFVAGFLAGMGAISTVGAPAQFDPQRYSKKRGIAADWEGAGGDLKAALRAVGKDVRKG